MKNFVSHVEIPVTDLEKAKKWYESIFDWTVNLQALEDYGVVFLQDYKTTIGFFKVDKIPENGYNIMFDTDNIEKTLKKIAKKGGKIVKEKYEISGGIGFSAQFEDIFGNSLGLHSYH